MPFLNDIIPFINDTLRGGALDKAKLQPAKFYGLSTPVFKQDGKQQERFPAIVDGIKITAIAPDSKLALQLYHKLMGKTYSYEKKSYGDGYDMKSTCDMQMVVICNSKLSSKSKDVLEPVFIFGMPQRLSAAVIKDLGISRCLITPVSSNLDSMSVFVQEYQGQKYPLSEQMSMFSIRYKIELLFSQECVDACLCD